MTLFEFCIIVKGTHVRVHRIHNVARTPVESRQQQQQRWWWLPIPGESARCPVVFRSGSPAAQRANVRKYDW